MNHHLFTRLGEPPPENAEMAGLIVVLPDATRMWIGDGPHLHDTNVDRLVQKLNAAIIASPKVMSRTCSETLDELKAILPEELYWHERPVD